MRAPDSRRRHVSDEVARRIESYAPRDVVRPVWDSTIRPFVVPLLYAAAPAGSASMEQYARVMTLIAVWCTEKGIPLDAERVLDPDTVERFYSEGLKGFPSRGTYRTVLRHLGRSLTKQAPWLPPPEPMRRRTVAPPYTWSELLTLEEDADRQSTEKRRRAARALIALGAGAGLDGRWVTKVRGVDVQAHRPAVLVRVGEPRPRLVPVLCRFEERVLELSAEAGEGLLIGGTSTHRNRTSRLVRTLEVGHGHPILSVPRLRSTWIVEHLRRGTRLPELLAAAGTSQIERFDELLERVDPLDNESAWRVLRGSG